MPNLIEKNIDFLKSVEKLSPYKRKKLLKSASEDNILALKEIAHNLLTGNLNVPEIKKLKRHRQSIRKFVKKKSSLKSKRKLLIQKGGFLPLMITPLLSAIGTVTGKVISKALDLQNG